MVYVSSNELTHYGILGMKWGIRRYQNPDGSLTEEGKKRYGTAENLEAGRTVKQASRYEKEKQTAINSGSVERVQKFSKELTKEEMEKAFQRIDVEQKLSKLKNEETVLGKEKLQNIIDIGGKVKVAGETMTSIYNIGAATYNAFNKDGKPLPIIGKTEGSKLDRQIKEVDLAIRRETARKLKAENDAREEAEKEKKKGS